MKAAYPIQARSPRRSGAALAIVIILIGLFTALSQSLAMLVAIQYRLAFQQAERAQVQRLAEAGLLRASLALERNPEWSGETWTPVFPTGQAAVEMRIRKSAAGSTIEAQATLTSPGRRIHQSIQTLAVPPASATDLTQDSTP